MDVQHQAWTNADLLSNVDVQWNPAIKATQYDGLSKQACHGGGVK